MSEENVQGKPKRSAAEIEAEIKQLELEEKRLSVEEKRANLQDVKERLEERQMKRDSLKDRSRTNAMTLEQNARRQKAGEDGCTHRKGGNGLGDYLGGKGQEPQFAVIKHRMLTGDIWVRCMRCGKTWKPPIRKNFYFNAEGKLVAPKDGRFDQTKFDAAVHDYREAVNFQTKNSTSSSYIFGYTDGGEYAREVLEPTTLR